MSNSPQQPLYMLTAVDMRRATESGNSRATIIEKLALPDIKFQTANHDPAGGVGAVEFTQPRIEKLEPKFSVKGIDLDAFRGMGLRERWSFAGALRDKKTNLVKPMRCTIEGAISEWSPDEMKPGDFAGCNHQFSEVVHYEISIDGVEVIYWNFWERILRRNGIDLFADERAALGA